MTIVIKVFKPVSQKPYPVAMKLYQWVKDEINKLLTTKVIWGIQSNWSAPIIVVPKGDGWKCLVINYCALNKITQKFIWPMPKAEDIFLQLNGVKFSQPWIFKQDITTFHWMNLWCLKQLSLNCFGKYEYIKVPFRLAQAPTCFQELMTGVLKDFPFTIAYLDDIIIFSRTAEEHLLHIRQVFEKLQNAYLSMKLSKCHFITKEI